MRSTEEIRQELYEAERAETAKREEAKQAVKVVMKYTIAPVEAQSHSFNELYDDTCMLYKLNGEVMNKEEAEAVGHNISSGGMTYIYNTLSGRIATSVGGGTVYISKSWGSRETDDSDVVAMNELNEFLRDHPEGGDITDIIERHQARRKVTYNKK